MSHCLSRRAASTCVFEREAGHSLWNTVLHLWPRKSTAGNLNRQNKLRLFNWVNGSTAPPCVRKEARLPARADWIHFPFISNKQGNSSIFIWHWQQRDIKIKTKLSHFGSNSSSQTTGGVFVRFFFCLTLKSLHENIKQMKHVACKYSAWKHIRFTVCGMQCSTVCNSALKGSGIYYMWAYIIPASVIRLHSNIYIWPRESRTSTPTGYI